MIIENIPAKNSDGSFNVLIEIPMNSSPVKYEFNKEIGGMQVDRILNTAMFYPANYGFIPCTLSGDGDPVDVLVISSYPINPGVFIKVRPVAVLMMEDESGVDEKIVSVPFDNIDITFNFVKDIDDLDGMTKSRISHFFEHYKKLDNGKWANVNGWSNSKAAHDIISSAIESYENQKQCS